MSEMLSRISNDLDLIDIGQRINKVLDNIPDVNINISAKGSDELGRDLTTILNTLEDKDDKNKEYRENFERKTPNLFFTSTTEQEFNSVFKDVQVPQERLTRYSLYKEFIDTIPIIKTIHSVYLDNLFPKNPTTGSCFIYKEVQKNKSSHKNVIDLESKKMEAKQILETIMDYYDLSDILRNRVIPERLIFGDIFVEVIDTKKMSNRIQTVGDLDNLINVNDNITESKQHKGYNTLLFERKINEYFSNSKSHSKQIFNELETFYSEIANHFVEHKQYPDDVIDYINHKQEMKILMSEDAGDDLTTVDINDKVEEITNIYDFDSVLIRVIDPKDVIILETKSGTRVGYIEVGRTQGSVFNNITQGLSHVVGKIVTIADNNSTGRNSRDSLVNQMLKFIVNKITDNIKNEGGEDPNATDAKNKLIKEAMKNIEPQLIDTIKRIVIEQSFNHENILNKINTRFIPVNRMVHFSTPGSVNSRPYSASIFDPLILPSKLYMLSQLSNVVTKLSRSANIRKWRIETGTTQDHSQLLQKVKRQLFNNRVTVDDLSNFRTIPKIMSDFKDMFVFTKQGNSLLDVSIEPMGDPSIKVADLEDARREIIALSGIPATYLGYADVVELRESLVHANVSFASRISNQQESDCKAIAKLLDIIAGVIGVPYRPSDYASCMLIPPAQLMIQFIEQSMNSLTNIQNSFAGMVGSEEKIDPLKLLKDYVPYINWDTFEESTAKRELDKTIDNEIKAAVDSAAMMAGGGDSSGGMMSPAM